MPISRKRKVNNKVVEEKKTSYSQMGNTKGGKILILVLAVSMVVGILAAAIILMIQYLA